MDRQALVAGARRLMPLRGTSAISISRSDADGDTAGSGPNAFARRYRSSVPFGAWPETKTACFVR